MTRRRSGKRWLYGLAVLVVLGGYVVWALERALPVTDAPADATLSTPVTPAVLAWPAAGQAAVGILGTPILDTHNPQTPTPTASTAKLITALTVLQAEPLQPGEQGPTITLGPSDAAIYKTYLGEDGSVVPVVAGEQITEYQMLEAMLLPSANNMADSLAIWAFGSLSAYSAAGQRYATAQGLTQTHIGTDASGFAPSTTSTAHDLVRLGELAMQNPVLKQIVGQASAGGIPVAGTIQNVNHLLGTAGIVGVKTGNTDQAGGVFISASTATVNGRPVTIVTALAGTPTLAQAMQASLPLVQSAQANFHPVQAVQAGTVLGRYQLPWGGTVAAVAARSLDLQTWNGSTLNLTADLAPITAGQAAGTIVGNVIVPTSALVNQQFVPIKLQQAVSAPSARWRLLHPF